MSDPEFSVIIPTLNAATHIGSALRSLAGQRFRGFEVIIADGVSADNTLEAAELFRDELPSLTAMSERDSGVYDAINRAIRVSRGRWIYVLGSDDRLASDRVLAEVAKHTALPDAEFVYGDVRVCGANRWVESGGRYAGPLGLGSILERNICQQAIFYKRTVFDTMGFFKAKYKVCADWEFALRAMAGLRTRWIDMVICDYAATGMSSKNDDETFGRDRPMLFLRLLLNHPCDTRLLAMRWRLYQYAVAARQQSHTWQAAALFAGGLWLAVLGRATQPWRS